MGKKILLDDNVQPVTLDGVEYLTVKDFAKVVNKSYTTVYMLMKYGTMDGTMQLESIEWNNRVLIPVTETEKIKKMPTVGRPRKEA